MARQHVVLEPVRATEQEAGVLKHLDQLLRPEEPQAKLVSATGEEIAIPESVYRLLRETVHLLASGRAVSLVPLHYELTTQEAADLLNVSRPFLIKLLEQREIPYAMVGSHRRIRIDDLLAYKHRRDANRREHLRQLTQFSQDEGFYQ